MGESGYVAWERMKPVSRRMFLRAASAAGLLSAFGRASGAAPVKVGDAELSVLSDGQLSLPLSFVLPATPEPEIRALFEANGIAMGPLEPDCNVTLLRRENRISIFDAGAGPNFMTTAGKLLESLSAAGIDPAQVTDVVFTHAHPDHLWGVLDEFEELVFPNASYHMSRTEWEFWRDPATVEKLPDDRKSFAVGAQTRLSVIEDRMNLFSGGNEVLPGVEAVDTSGHTPGHTSFLVHGGGEQVLIAGDAITHAVISFQKPEWPSGSDQDAAKGAATRKALLDRLAADKGRMIGFHLPHPGVGRVERKDQSFRFVAEG
jgi:glyoxylase-like metal-dependent hydrolase (beta-lactamase superfamily II)